MAKSGGVSVLTTFRQKPFHWDCLIAAAAKASLSPTGMVAGIAVPRLANVAAIAFAKGSPRNSNRCESSQMSEILERQLGIAG
jgi:hypothetical protein